MYNHFNKTLWKKVDLYGREKMRKDVETLKSLGRSHRKRRDVFSQQQQFTMQQEGYKDKRRNEKLFQICLQNYNNEAMLKNLKKALDKKSDYMMSPNEVDELAHYMMQSGGGCSALEHDIAWIPLR